VSSIATEDTTHYLLPVSLFAATADRVSVYEVSLRDGLQNERATVPLRGKLRLVDALVQAGCKRIEITSFVSPKWIPQLADADEVAEHAKAPEGVTFSALCPNARGLERARAAGMREIAVFISASETHNKKNVNKTVDETLTAFEDTIGPARATGMRVRAYVSTVWGCPYEGDVDPKRALAIARKLLAMGCYQVSLSDTIGAGTPRQTERILEMALAEIPREQIAMHMHDTRGTALANVLVGLEMGIRDFDASVGGLGGCPYAPGAAGNLATEDLVYMLQGMGVTTGIDLDRLVEAGKVAESIVGRQLPGKVHQAGVRSLKA
jgi:hydroxymethylglutaryl-CoA lyase